MHTILLIRHGETDWNRSGQIMGEQPIPLNDTGRRQASDLAVVLRDCPLTSVYTSPVLRALQTTEIVAASRSIAVQEEGRLREIGVGDWAGRYWHELDHEPARLAWYTHPHEARFPNGETLGEVQQRAVSAVLDALAQHPAGTLAFVSHGDVLRALVAHFLRLPLEAMRAFRFDHAAVTALTLNGPYCWARSINHLPVFRIE